MPSFQIAVDIRAPVERVFAVMLDVERWSEWTASIRGIERLDSGPFAVGSRVRIRQPRVRTAIWTVTGLQPPHSFTWTTKSLGVSATGVHSVWPAPAGSCAELRLAFEGPLAGLIARVGRRLVEHYLALESQGLKARSEAGVPL
jgi:uncharacterized protein YndB with AHSA1/START domain